MIAVSQPKNWAKSRYTNKKSFSIWSCSLLLVFNYSYVSAQATVNTNTSQDSTNQSSRERDRVLLKRSPIASEYQTLSAPGDVLGAPFDAEGVDFRSQFRLSKGKPNGPMVRAEANLNYQSIAKEAVAGGSIKLAKSLGKLSLQLQAQKSNSERLVDLYASRWLLDTNSDLSTGDVLTLGYPRYTQDGIQTQSINTRWRADYQVNEALLVSYEGLNTNYDDIATRNRFEVQFGAADLSDTVLSHDGSTISEAAVSDARIRRYFHRLDTARDVNRHKLGFTLDKDNGSLEVNTYFSRWVNDKLWLPWNFIDSDVSATYTLNDKYLPTVNVTNSDIYDTSNAVYSNYRVAKSVTTDTDYAFLVNWDKQFTFAEHDLWLEAGASWRNKERAVDNDRAVYGSTTNSFYLDELVANNTSTRIIDNGFSLPAGLGVSNGAAYFDNNLDEQFELNLSQSFLETIQDIYSSEETVSSVYVNAYQQRQNWFWRAGVRFEKTETATRGAVYASPDTDIASQGDAITSVMINGELVEETFDSFDAAFVEGGNDYQHWLPSLELRYAANSQLTLKTAYFQQLMRPQYFDTVSYRRANVATLSITEGNPNLEATTIENLYAGIEYQYSNSGQLVAGVYYNSVSDFFYDSNTTELIGEDLYEVARVENGKDGFIRGIQAFWLQQFSLAMISKAEVKLGYTYSDSEAELSDRTIAMPERAEHRVAFNLLLAQDDWQYRSQFSWQSEAVDDVGASAMQDTIREKVLIWNQAVTWHYSEQVAARVSLNNILDYPERSYQGQPNRVINNLYSGSTARFSVAVTF
ncbi:TonB-dependent receptor [uncultured Paraglaciecola sp.]|uniref:TonB-dependent receptor domain-containing protein n=1 Tax=uncultured Paraglaciecola sp. TaxID=1765024 RepID=UPI00259AA698|nr:TonB-dependent receptor [uncultured Paraglaciecola sp.]